MASRIDESKGTVSIIVYDLRKGKPGWADILWPTAFLFDAHTGDLRGTYAFDPALSGGIVCFNAQDGYSLAAVDNGMLALDIVPIR